MSTHANEECPLVDLSENYIGIGAEQRNYLVAFSM